MDDLRLAVGCLPRATRSAMLDGLAGNDIIVGAYSNRDGICPMLAAHRGGGRTSFIGFAEAWDRFAQRSVSTRRARRATERELLILRSYLQASLLEDEAGGSSLGSAIAEHRELAAQTAANARAERAARAADAERASRAATRGRRRRQRPGDADRSRELRQMDGWAWTRIFRRYDEYERALARLEGLDENRADAATVARTPSPV